jgi:hypothetical protein
MVRERQYERPRSAGGGGPSGPGDADIVEEVRAVAGPLFEAADRVLDGRDAGRAEDLLQGLRQRGGQ